MGGSGRIWRRKNGRTEIIDVEGIAYCGCVCFPVQPLKMWGGSFPNADFEASGSSHKHILMHCSGVDIHGSWSFGFAYLLMVGRKQNRVQEHRSFGCLCFAMGGNDYV
jgi:hypothetical protein